MRKLIVTIEVQDASYIKICGMMIFQNLALEYENYSANYVQEDFNGKQVCKIKIEDLKEMVQQ